jgi:hypothetical protein
MNKTLRIVLIVVAVLVVAFGLLGTGFFIGRAAFGWNSFHNPGMMGLFNRYDQDSRYGYSMMDNFGGQGMMGGRSYSQEDGQQCDFGPGMMNRRGYSQNQGEQCPYGPGMMDNFEGSGMMGDFGGYGMMGEFGGHGMMGGFSTSTNAEPLSAEESLTAVETYLSGIGNDDLVVAEIMVFENNSYAIVKEESTGIGAFELLIDPATKNVFPEVGPNMMWNLKYGMHAAESGMMGGTMGHGMMGGNGYDFSGEFPDASSEMTVTADQALELAQNYLDAHQPGVTVSDEITTFYGYYTIDLEQDGAIVGMLSVNGFNGQVFPHTWHGTFIDMLEVE